MLTDPRTRPTPITIVAILCLVAGALLLLSAASLIVIGGFLGMNGVQVGARDDPALAFLFGFLSLCLGVAYLGLYQGFWHLRSWAFVAGFVVAGAGMVVVLVGLALGFGDATSALTDIVVGVAVMGVLLLPSSQSALGHGDLDQTGVAVANRVGPSGVESSGVDDVPVDATATPATRSDAAAEGASTVAEPERSAAATAEERAIEQTAEPPASGS